MASQHHRQHLSQYLREHKTRKPSKLGDNASERKGSSSTIASRISGSSGVGIEGVGNTYGQSHQNRATLNYLPVRRPSEKATIHHLPDELILKIFGYLNAGDLLAVTGVCKRWQPLANDNLLWNAVYEKYGNLEGATSGSGGDRQPSSYWKSLCIKQCSERRNRRAMKFMKKISPFTGLQRDTDKAIKAAGVYFQLELVDIHQNEHAHLSRDIFHHSMATCARWFDLEMTAINNVRKLRVYSCNPFFFNKDSSALKNSPFQRSLLLSQDLSWGQWVKTNSPACSDDMVNMYILPQGLLIATWKEDGELAFICCGLHHNELLRRCLFGSSVAPVHLKTHKVVRDDIDSAYGLHDYQCTVELHTLRQSIWSQQFTNLCCRKESIAGSGYIVLPLIRKDFNTDHVVLQKKLHFPWKTDAFKGVVENLVWLDVTVLDERQEPFWCVSTATKLTGKMQADNYNFDYTNQEVFHLSYTDEKAKLVMHLSQTDHKEYFITSIDLKLSVSAVNEWFGTNYR